MKIIKKCNPWIVAVLVIIFLDIGLGFYVQKQSEYHNTKCELEEIESGIYTRYYQIVSSIPAHNYDVVEICINGNMRTYKGTVRITYTTEHPYAIIMQNNLVNSDKVFLYIPKGTVDYKENVGIR